MITHSITRRLIIAGLIACSWFGGAELAADQSFLYVSLMQDRKIVTYKRDQELGLLTRQSELGCSAEPGVMCTSPDKKWLFVAHRSSGQLASYAIDSRSGGLRQLSVIEGGDDPAYLQVDHTGKFLLTAYYVANKVSVHAILPDGRIGKEPVQTVFTAARAHGFSIDSTNRTVLVPHTGANRIFQFNFDANHGRLTAKAPPFIGLSDGEEPRHSAIHPNDRWAYANSEAGDAINVFEIDKALGTLTAVQNVSTLPVDFDGKQNSTARCEMTVDGRFIYVANRGHNSIAGFRIDPSTGRVTALGQTPTAKTPRSFSISPDGRFLYAAGQDGGRVVLYGVKRDGSLERRVTYEVGPTPWAVLAVDVK